jgi:Zn-dependent protease with chaperone function
MTRKAVHPIVRGVGESRALTGQGKTRRFPWKLNRLEQAARQACPAVILMQMTGEICELCGHPVLSEVEGAQCAHCNATFHKCCLEGAPQVCIHCGEIPFESGAETEPGRSPLQFAEGELTRPKTTWLYRFGLVLVSLGMITLPLIYVGLVVMFGYGVWWYAIHATPARWTEGVSGPTLSIVFLFYLGPLFVGTLLTFFLVKPLFAPRREKREAFALNHADAPQLFALLGWICRSLNAPIPSRVDVSCDLNAGAGFRGGFKSLFGNDIALTIGLPLVSGLNLSQFAGVIAHEYGHFSQGTAMRAYYLIHRVNAWFYRVVYERDAWDLYLIEQSEEDGQDARMMILFWMARAGVWFGRSILWVLMAAGNLLSSFMSRQMEFDADQYEIKLAGSDHFVSTVMRLQQLNLGFAAARKEVAKKWKSERKLYDQIPELVVNRANEIPAEAQERHYVQAFKRKTRLFDSHPSDAERMQRAREARDPGMFLDTAPATSLFTDYPGLSRRLTIFFYRDLIGAGFSVKALVSTNETAARAEHDYAADRETIKRYFLGVVAESLPIVLHENKAPMVRRTEVLREEIGAMRVRMEEILPAAQEALAEYAHAEMREWQAGQAAQLLDAGFQFDPSEFGLAEGDAESVQIEATEARNAAEAGLEEFRQAGRTRIMNTVQLLRSPNVAATMPNASQLQDQAREMIFVLSRSGELFELLLELRRECAMLDVLLRYRREQPSADNITTALENACTGIQDRVNRLQELTSQIRYPFPHTTEQILVSQYVRNKEYHADPFEMALREGRSHVEKLLDLYCRALANLIAICETVEQVVI